MASAFDAGPVEGCGEWSLEEITSAAYRELRRLANAYLANSGSLTLQPTALVHEAYLRMAGQDNLRWRNRGHFFGIAAQCMRHILVDHARMKAAEKRGGNLSRCGPEALLTVGAEPSAGILELDDALQTLAQIDLRQSQLIELHYFGGLDYEAMAETVGVSVSTVKRDLREARAWLHKELTEAPQ